MKPRDDGDSPLAIGLTWGTRCVTLGLEFALPALLGHWVDQGLGSQPWATVAGAILGFGIGFYGLYRIVGQRARPGDRP